MLKKWILPICALMSPASFADETIPIFCQNSAQSIFNRMYTPPILLRSKVEARLKEETKTYRDRILATHQHVVFVPYGSKAVPFLLQHAYDPTGGTHYYGPVAEGGYNWKSPNPYVEYKEYLPNPGYTVKVIPGVPYRNDEHTLTGTFPLWKMLRPLSAEEEKGKPTLTSEIRYTSPYARKGKPTPENPNPEPEPGIWKEAPLERAFSRGDIYFSVSNGTEELIIVPSDWKTPLKQP
jgi:hypothetical protein